MTEFSEKSFRPHLDQITYEAGELREKFLLSAALSERMAVFMTVVRSMRNKHPHFGPPERAYQRQIFAGLLDWVKIKQWEVPMIPPPRGSVEWRAFPSRRKNIIPKTEAIAYLIPNEAGDNCVRKIGQDALALADEFNHMHKFLSNRVFNTEVRHRARKIQETYFRQQLLIPPPQEKLPDVSGSMHSDF